MSQLLMAIALWCGQPYNQSFEGVQGWHNRFGSFKTPEQVTECRSSIIACQSKRKFSDASFDCFK